jgi:hypothetical protein
MRVDEVVRKIESERNQKQLCIVERKNQEELAKRLDSQYASEFKEEYSHVQGLTGLTQEFIDWASRQDVQDRDGIVKNGKQLYEHLVNSASKKYAAKRKQGVIVENAFIEATSEIAGWLTLYSEKSASTGGTIFVNYPPETLYRMKKKMEMNW